MTGTRSTPINTDAHVSADLLPAVIWVADDPEWKRYTARCLDYCDHMGYKVVAIVEERAGGRWVDVSAMLNAGRAAVVVVASRDQPPRNRIPRIESVADERRHLVPRQAMVSGNRPTFLRR